MAVDSQLFKKALGCWPSGVTVITVRTPGGWHGMTASAFCSVSLDPPLVLVCVGRKAQMHGYLELADDYVVQVLGADQQGVSNWFAGWRPEGSTEPVTRPVHGDGHGPPVIEGAVAILHCSAHANFDGGDHTVFVGCVEAVEVLEGSEPLLYHRGKYRMLGSEL